MLQRGTKGNIKGVGKTHAQRSCIQRTISAVLLAAIGTSGTHTAQHPPHPSASNTTTTIVSELDHQSDFSRLHDGVLRDTFTNDAIAVIPPTTRELPDVRERQLTKASDARDGLCTLSPIWKRKVNPKRYRYGCAEIKEMMMGDTALVGSGMIRDVHLVEYEGRTVVVKTLRDVEDLSRQKDHAIMHRREVLSLDAVRGQPNIVGLLGVCDTTLVTEYYELNFQRVVLRREEPLPIRKVVSMAADIARGMRALHEAPGGPIVHFDFKPQQVLITEDGRAKINDLNMAHFLAADADGDPCPFRARGIVRIVPWRSPENISGEPMTEAVDIYSMAMIFFSLIAGEVPFREEADLLAAGGRPTIDSSWHQGYVEIVQEMWSEDPKDRPTARQVVKRLKRILKDLPVDNSS